MELAKYTNSPDGKRVDAHTPHIQRDKRHLLISGFYGRIKYVIAIYESHKLKIMPQIFNYQ